MTNLEKRIDELQATILDYSARVNMYEVQVGGMFKTLDEQLLIKRELETKILMYETKVGRLRRTISEYMNKYENDEK